MSTFDETDVARDAAGKFAPNATSSSTAVLDDPAGSDGDRLLSLADALRSRAVRMQQASRPAEIRSAMTAEKAIASYVRADYPTAAVITFAESDEEPGQMNVDQVLDAGGNVLDEGWDVEHGDDIQDCAYDLRDLGGTVHSGAPTAVTWGSDRHVGKTARLDIEQGLGLGDNGDSRTLAVGRAQEVFDVYDAAHGDPDGSKENAVADMFTDLQHWAAREGIDLDALYESSGRSYSMEVIDWAPESELP